VIVENIEEKIENFPNKVSVLLNKRAEKEKNNEGFKIPSQKSFEFVKKLILFSFQELKSSKSWPL
jgi:hypothetical protein